MASDLSSSHSVAISRGCQRAGWAAGRFDNSKRAIASGEDTNAAGREGEWRTHQSGGLWRSSPMSARWGGCCSAAAAALAARWLQREGTAGRAGAEACMPCFFLTASMKSMLRSRDLSIYEYSIDPKRSSILEHDYTSSLTRKTEQPSPHTQPHPTKHGGRSRRRWLPHARAAGPHGQAGARRPVTVSLLGCISSVCASK